MVRHAPEEEQKSVDRKEQVNRHITKNDIDNNVGIIDYTGWKHGEVDHSNWFFCIDVGGGAILINNCFVLRCSPSSMSIRYE